VAAHIVKLGRLVGARLADQLGLLPGMTLTLMSARGNVTPFGVTPAGLNRAATDPIVVAQDRSVAFDPARIADVATYADPQRPPDGIAHVFVNGEAVVRYGAHTGARSGRVVRKRS